MAHFAHFLLRFVHATRYWEIFTQESLNQTPSHGNKTKTPKVELFSTHWGSTWIHRWLGWPFRIVIRRVFDYYHKHSNRYFFKIWVRRISIHKWSGGGGRQNVSTDTNQYRGGEINDLCHSKHLDVHKHTGESWQNDRMASSIRNYSIDIRIHYGIANTAQECLPHSRNSLVTSELFKDSCVIASPGVLRWWT